VSLAWTHVMAYADVRAMLGLAHAGLDVEGWRFQAAAETRLLAGSRRTTQLRIAATILRAHEGTIVDDGFLSDLRDANESAARDLVYARYLASVPIAVAIARASFRDRAGSIRTSLSRQDLDTSLAHEIPNAAQATRNRTRTAIGSQFSRAGVLYVERDGTCVFTRRQPDVLAIYHLIRDDLRDRREASDTWLAAGSLAATLFAIDARAMHDHIDALVAAGRLQRSYYAGQPRILAA
jgi:hypothetical protein